MAKDNHMGRRRCFEWCRISFPMNVKSCERIAEASPFRWRDGWLQRWTFFHLAHFLERCLVGSVVKASIRRRRRQLSKRPFSLKRRKRRRLLITTFDFCSGVPIPSQLRPAAMSFSITTDGAMASGLCSFHLQLVGSARTDVTFTSSPLLGLLPLAKGPHASSCLDSRSRSLRVSSCLVSWSSDAS